MKNSIIYIGILIVGVILGGLIFSSGNSNETSTQENHDHSSEETEIWTCSMHPQIKLPEPGDCPICGMDLIPLVNNNSDKPLVIEMTEEAIQLMNIKTTIVGEDARNDGSLQISGKIIANETTTASIVSHIPGRIEKLYVAFTGERIRKGQIIAKIYSPNLITAQKELIETAKIKNINPKLYQAAVNKLKYWKITDKQINEILQSNKIKESFGIYAEHSGIVSNKRVSVGDHLMEGGILFDIQNLDKLWVEFDVYEADLQLVHLNDEVKFTTPSLAGKEFKSKIAFIDPVINPKTRSASIRLEVSNASHDLKPEMFVNGFLISKKGERNQLTVPKSAVLWTGTRSVVYVKQKDVSIPSFEFREITIGGTSGETYIVSEGIEQGEEIVTKGSFVIDASAQLNNQASMMNRQIIGATTGEKETPDYKSTTPKEFLEQFEVLLQVYYKLKDALVNDNVTLAKKESQNTLIALKKTDMSLLKGDAHLYWMDQMKMIQKHAEKIKSINDIEKQRANFEMISTSIINSSKAFGTNSNAYILFCPMASENKGAFWLSKSSTIENPYFGQEMLSCGSVEGEIINK